VKFESDHTQFTFTDMESAGLVSRTPSSRQKRAMIKIDCYTNELKYTAAGV